MASFSGVVSMLPNVLRVSTEGSDATGAAGGAPFRTVAAAVAAATSGQLVWILPGVYDEAPSALPMRVADAVSIDGGSASAVTVRARDVLVDTDLFVLLGACRIMEITAQVTTSRPNVRVRCFVVATDAAVVGARLRSLVATADNSAAGATATADAIALHVDAPGTTTPTPVVPSTSFLTRVVTLNAFGAGTGRAVALLNATPNITVAVRDTGMRATRAAGSAATRAYGAEVNHASASLLMRVATCDGAASDVSRTAGALTLQDVALVNASASGTGFVTARAPPTYTWGLAGTMPPAGAYYMFLGTVSRTMLSATRAPGLVVMRPSLAIAISVRAQTPPGGAVTDTFAVHRNGAPTALAVSLTGAATTATNVGQLSVSLAAGDEIAVVLTTPGSSATSNVVVQVNVY